MKASTWVSVWLKREYNRRRFGMADFVKKAREHKNGASFSRKLLAEQPMARIQMRLSKLLDPTNRPPLQILCSPPGHKQLVSG
jgi:hypothetical protein